MLVNMIQPYVIKNIYYVFTYYLAMQHLSYHNPNPWPSCLHIQRNDLNTGLFLRTCLGGGGESTKRDHTIMSVER
jgi:hypothetical protein